MKQPWWCAIFCLQSCLFQTSRAKERPMFLAPVEMSEIEDIFVKDNVEFVFVNTMVSHTTGRALCRHQYKGQLPQVKTIDLADFLAEALSETNLNMHLAWTGGERHGNFWYWMEDAIPSPINSDITNLLVNYSRSVKTEDRKCLAIGRKLHLLPQFPTFNCKLQRPIICERPFVHDNGSTHEGWIRYGNLMYKIFREPVVWMKADIKCYMYDRTASLAYIPDFHTAKVLARHMLVGRPSLERAWIGAKYVGQNYEFVKEQIVLANKTEGDYPPWIVNEITKGFGCVLLDRHLRVKTSFVEARCLSPRAYICSKTSDNKDIIRDIIIEDYGYRIFFYKVPWDEAKSKCDYYQKYQAKLAEIREKKIVDHLLYIMGENVTALEHIWLGGKFISETKQWIWVSDNSLVQIDGVLQWVKNTTYSDAIEKMNTCLNMDRENFIQALHYGTYCEYDQHFICMFSKANLLKLQEDELFQRNPKQESA